MFIIIVNEYSVLLFFFFFFQAEDGIRDLIVTGVQTCALPIYTQEQAGPPALSSLPEARPNMFSKIRSVVDDYKPRQTPQARPADNQPDPPRSDIPVLPPFTRARFQIAPPDVQFSDLPTLSPIPQKALDARRSLVRPAYSPRPGEGERDALARYERELGDWRNPADRNGRG